ncbi:MAG: RIP metalloprotease RseP [Chloroflexi bacterium]|nr:RIP metalloprotease RseP [Chloroflexota bacterium]
MSTLITIFSFIIVLGILVFFHEFGHYWVARRNGIVVQEFGMGYPPRLAKLFTYDGTEFTINLIPFGGFARMKGEDASDLSPGSFNAASRWGRAATLIAGPAMNAILSVFLFAFSFMAGFPAEAAYPQVTDVAAGSVAAQVGLQKGDILLQAGNRPTQVSAAPNLDYTVWHKNAPAETTPVSTLKLSRDGKIMELPIQGQAQVDQLLSAIEYTPVLDTQISATAANSPAAQAGLQAGDVLYRVNDTPISFAAPLSDVVRENLGKEISLTVLRNYQWQTFKLTPRPNPPAGEGALGVEIGAVTQLATMPFLTALREGAAFVGQYVKVVLQMPIMLIRGQLAPADAQLSGPVGIAHLVGGAVTATIETGLWFPIWRLSGILSVALAITNLLPLPALDGGRLLFILIEALRGRRINPEREGFVHMVGFMLLLGLLVYITVQDIRTTPIGIDWNALLGQ